MAHFLSEIRNKVTTTICDVYISFMYIFKIWDLIANLEKKQTIVFWRHYVTCHIEMVSENTVVRTAICNAQRNFYIVTYSKCNTQPIQLKHRAKIQLCRYACALRNTRQKKGKIW